MKKRKSCDETKININNFNIFIQTHSKFTHKNIEKINF